MRKVLLLDTKGTCFLCLKESVNDDEEERVTTEIICLQKICRYLDINQCSIILKGLKDAGRHFTEEEKEEAIRQGNNCDFSVRLCLACSSLANHLSELLEQLEMTKMMIHQKLERFHQILTESSDDQIQLMEEHRDKLTTEMMKNGKIVEARFVMTLREKSITQSSEKVKNQQFKSFPRVQLKKIKWAAAPPSFDDACSDDDIIVNPSPELTNSLSSRNFCTNSTATNASKDSVLRALLSSSSTRMPAFVSVPNAKKREAVKKRRVVRRHLPGRRYNTGRDDPHSVWVRNRCDMFFRRTELANMYECQLCKRVFLRANIRRHIVGCHPEVILEREKLPNESQEEFREHCKNALEAAVISARKGAGLPKKQYFCKLCNNNQVMELSMFNFRHHLVVEHYGAVVDAVRTLQGGGRPEVAGIAEESTAPNTSNTLKMWACQVSEGGCGEQFLSKIHMIMHKKSCPKKIKYERQAERRFVCEGAMGGCGTRFSTARNLRRHKMYTCPHKKTTQDVICDPNYGGKIKYERQEFTPGTNFKRYLCKACGQKFSCGSNLNRHKKLHCPRRNTQQSICCDSKYGGCGQIFSAMIFLREHCRKSGCPVPIAPKVSNCQENVVSNNENGIQQTNPYEDAQITSEPDPLAMESFVEEEAGALNDEASVAVPIVVGETVCDWATKSEAVVESVEDADNCEFESFV